MWSRFFVSSSSSFGRDRLLNFDVFRPDDGARRMGCQSRPHLAHLAVVFRQGVDKWRKLQILQFLNTAEIWNTILE